MVRWFAYIKHISRSIWTPNLAYLYVEYQNPRHHATVAITVTCERLELVVAMWRLRNRICSQRRRINKTIGSKLRSEPNSNRIAMKPSYGWFDKIPTRFNGPSQLLENFIVATRFMFSSDIFLGMQGKQYVIWMWLEFEFACWFVF